MKPRVFVPEPIATAGLDLLSGETECVAPWLSPGNRRDTAADRDTMRDCHAVIVRLFTITASDLDDCHQLQVIAKHGVGVDNVDLQAAYDHGVQVVFTPQANSNAVAEHTVALMLALARQIEPAAHAARHQAEWERGQFQGVELAGKTLGVVGLGRIGASVARIAKLGLSMRVIGYDPFLKDAAQNPGDEICPRVEDLFERADFLTFHVPLNDATRHLVRDDTLALMKPTARIVNTSRGGVVDEGALVRALEQDALAGAALDVYQQEPLPTDHPFRSAPKLLLTPHISSSTRESLDRMAVDAAQGVLDVLAGRAPTYPVNMEAMGVNTQ